MLAYVISKFDQNNCLLYGLPAATLKKLQRVQNAAACLVSGAKKYDDAFPLLHKLHWRPVTYRINFKIDLLTYKALHGQCPAYISNLFHIHLVVSFDHALAILLSNQEQKASMVKDLLEQLRQCFGINCQTWL